MELRKDGNGSGRDPVTRKFLPGHKGGALAGPKVLRQVNGNVGGAALEGDIQAIKAVLDRVMPIQSMAMEGLQT